MLVYPVCLGVGQIALHLFNPSGVALFFCSVPPVIPEAIRIQIPFGLRCNLS